MPVLEDVTLLQRAVHKGFQLFVFQWSAFLNPQETGGGPLAAAAFRRLSYEPFLAGFNPSLAGAVNAFHCVLLSRTLLCVGGGGED